MGSEMCIRDSHQRFHRCHELSPAPAKQYKQNVSTEKIVAARGLLQELKGHGGGAAVAAIGAGPAASAADMSALVGALERLVDAYIELAMVGVDIFCFAGTYIGRVRRFRSACIASPRTGRRG